MSQTFRPCTPRPPMAGRRRQAGATLLEVMISILIMAIGLLGIAAMQATALRNGQSSLERTQAVMQSYAVLDILRANRTAAIAGYYNTAGMQCEGGDPDDSLPEGHQTAQGELNAWLMSLKSTMGLIDDETTCAEVACAGNAFGGGTCTVTIQWDDSRGTASDDGEESETGEGSETRQVVTVSAL
ncbi:type IV pilus modification protein PilV [Pseudoxanthomonas suwonensis]|uniref:type IV pilus modification protein PilV n=1 Tax=Pseudoxanthomonas suwonensis TaxID=314722 RepID=UPI001B87CE5E|nr:type IV pilus modification protein PilV [Pseudoxanthomonas suwonensis]